jgi:hypothetical protein
MASQRGVWVGEGIARGGESVRERKQPTEPRAAFDNSVDRHTAVVGQVTYTYARTYAHARARTHAHARTHKTRPRTGLCVRY